MHLHNMWEDITPSTKVGWSGHSYAVSIEEHNDENPLRIPGPGKAAVFLDESIRTYQRRQS